MELKNHIRQKLLFKAEFFSVPLNVLERIFNCSVSGVFNFFFISATFEYIKRVSPLFKELIGVYKEKVYNPLREEEQGQGGSKHTESFRSD